MRSPAFHAPMLPFPVHCPIALHHALRLDIILAAPERAHTTSLMHQHIASNDHKFMTRHDQPSTAYSSNLFNSFTYLFSLGLRSSFLVLRMPQSPDCASAVSLLHLISTSPSVPPTRQRVNINLSHFTLVLLLMSYLLSPWSILL